MDVKNGKCVRLIQGRADQETVYSDDPVAMAGHWDEEGAKLIHVVDLDGAFDGIPKNADLIKNIIYNSSVDIQVGGGIRTLKAIENLCQCRGLPGDIWEPSLKAIPNLSNRPANSFPEKSPWASTPETDSSPSKAGWRFPRKKPRTS